MESKSILKSSGKLSECECVNGSKVSDSVVTPAQGKTTELSDSHSLMEMDKQTIGEV